MAPQQAQTWFLLLQLPSLLPLQFLLLVLLLFVVTIATPTIQSREASFPRAWLACLMQCVRLSIYIRILADACSIYGLTKLQRHMKSNIWDLSKIGSSHSTITLSFFRYFPFVPPSCCETSHLAAETERQGKLAVFRCFMALAQPLQWLCKRKPVP